MKDGRNWAALAKAVESARDELGITQAEVQARGGPSSTMVSKIERQALDDVPRRRTLRSLGMALGKGPEWAEAILAGQVPPDQGGERTRVGIGWRLPPTAPRLTDADIEELRAKVEWLRSEAQVFEADRELDPDFRWEMAASLRRSYVLYGRLLELIEERHRARQNGTETS